MIPNWIAKATETIIKDLDERTGQTIDQYILSSMERNWIDIILKNCPDTKKEEKK